MEKSENKVNVNLIYLLKLIKAVVSDAQALVGRTATRTAKRH